MGTFLNTIDLILQRVCRLWSSYRALAKMQPFLDLPLTIKRDHCGVACCVWVITIPKIKLSGVRF